MLDKLFGRKGNWVIKFKTFNDETDVMEHKYTMEGDDVLIMLGFLENFLLRKKKKREAHINLYHTKRRGVLSLNNTTFDKDTEMLSVFALSRIQEIDPNWGNSSKRLPIFKNAQNGKNIPLMDEWSQKSLNEGYASFESTKAVVDALLSDVPRPATFFDIMDNEFFET